MKTITFSEFQSNLLYYMMLVEEGTDIVIKSNKNIHSKQQVFKNNKKRPYGFKGNF
ncbi:MAG: hypothetical protein QG635_920 [Bacteroidota bacterium]|nr:hypothetical protein [Bacteroidota bacterium]